MNALSPRTLAVREQPLPEPVIRCPHCQGDIKTESLAAPWMGSEWSCWRDRVR
jgi:hypothetical protein